MTRSFSRVHEDNRHLLLPHPLLPSAGVQHSAAQGGLRFRSAPLLQPLWRPAVAEVRLSEDSRGEAAKTCLFFMLGADHKHKMLQNVTKSKSSFILPFSSDLVPTGKSKHLFC